METQVATTARGQKRRLDAVTDAVVNEAEPARKRKRGLGKATAVVSFKVTSAPLPAYYQYIAFQELAKVLSLFSTDLVNVCYEYSQAHAVQFQW